MGRSEKNRHAKFEDLFTGRRGLAIGLFAAFAILLSTLTNIERLRAFGAFGAGAYGTLGYASNTLVDQPGWELVTAVERDGAAAKAGVVPGMRIRFDHPYEANVDYAAGRAVGITAVDTPGAPGDATRHLTLVAEPASLFWAAPLAQVDELIYSIGQWLALALGTVAILRGWGSLTALTLGIGLLGYSHENVVPIWVTWPAAAIGWQVANYIAEFGGLGLLLLPAALYVDRIHAPSRGWRWALGAIAGLWAAMNIVRLCSKIFDASYPVLGNGQSLFWIMLFLLNFQGLYWCWRGRREATGTDRARFGPIMFATFAQILNGFLFIFAGLWDLQANGIVSWLIQIGLLLIVNLLIPLGLAYAVLRHRVIDLGFAINRTVVYASVSAILLASFGLIEWSIEHLLPEQWVKASAWLDAGAAVLVYLAFHRVHDAVEHRIEDLFFRAWRENEEALRQFVGTVAHFEDEGTLVRAFADELSRFSGGGQVALYRRNPGSRDNRFTRVGGSWEASPRSLAADDAAYARMRAERRPIELGDTRTDLPGVLALPMLDHVSLAGLALMDLKESGGLFRPDEIAALGHAAHEVALALASLHAASIEARNRQLATENRVLKGEMTRLADILGERLKRAEPPPASA